MAKNINHTNRFLYCILWLCISWIIIAPINSFATTTQNKKTPFYLLDTLVKVYRSQIGVRELTGNNDGVEVEMYLASVGLKKGQPYCAAGVSWSFMRAGIKAVKSGWSPAWFTQKYVIYKKGIASLQKEPQQGDVGGYYYANLGRYGHTFFIDYWSKHGSFCITVEFNGTDKQTREGNGVVRNIVPKSKISVVARYLPKHNTYIPFKNDKLLKEEKNDRRKI